ncbi:DUF3099 domain-containing protein [Corynebacterium sp. zg254]|uniref:DUF3099 domain-containing protein n=2 Tax=Corynebacteriaceae TaxID=1653 RepID=A0ABQ6VG48_9CORY|nr:DUF3099 domain-containing protein [Corynebacterium zhongnanshanii]MCR5913469.1 DUF3099 domain-containing protein [Corynebacterium sp. zg254]
MPCHCPNFQLRTSVETMAAGGRREHDVELITDARRSPLEGWHRRRRLYMILQAIRLPLFLASGLVWWLLGNQVLAVVIVCISLPLPWVAVLLANERGEADKKSRSVYKPGLVRENRARVESARRAALESGETHASSSPAPVVIDHDGRSQDR